MKELDLWNTMTIAKKDLEVILDKMGYTKQFYHAALVDMSAYSEDLDHLEFAYFLLVAGQQEIYDKITKETEKESNC